jgi:hypothetical protein
MTEQPPKLPRKPFGYDPTVVDQLMADRDQMLSVAERRVREAEGKAARLEEQLAAKELALKDVKEKLSAPPPPPEPDREPQWERQQDDPPLTSRFMTEELGKIIEAAEESTSQILERARASTREQIVEAHRLWQEVQAEVARITTWREGAASVVRSVQSAVEKARVEIDGLPDRIQNALSPAVEAMVKVDAGMARFAAATTIPALANIAGLEEARARVAASAGATASTPTPAPTPTPVPAGVPSPAPSATSWPSMPAMFDTSASALSDLNDADWPSLEGSSFLDGEEDVASEAGEELREFAAGSEETGKDASDGSQLWGA